MMLRPRLSALGPLGLLAIFTAVVGATPDCNKCAESCSLPTVTETVPGCCPQPSTVTVTKTETKEVPSPCPKPPAEDTITVVSTVYTTKVVPTTEYEVSVTTDVVTTTDVTTKTTSYPVTVTTSVCTGPDDGGKGDDGKGDDGKGDSGKGYTPLAVPVPTDDEHDCVYYTTTVWKTKTEKSTRTIHVPTTTTVSVPKTVPTTHFSTDTVTDVVTEVSTYSTISTFTSTYTYTSLVPTTVVSDHTEYVTSTYTTVSTFTEAVWFTDTTTHEVTDTATVVTTATQSVTLPPDTITLPASTLTTTLDGETIIITLPGTTIVDVSTATEISVTTLPGETTVTTLTETEPASTITVTLDGETVTSVIPGPTNTITTTIVGPPVTVTRRLDVTACPAPTNVPGVNPDIPFDPSSNRTWGCNPGYVCDPPKPQGCNLWADSPADDYVCQPRHCIPSPPYTLTRWEEGETGYYPPSDGYFNLNPNAFGLPFSIFDFETIVKKIKGKKVTITTGNWGPATEITVFPLPRPTETPPKGGKDGKGYDKRQTGSETVAPNVCFDDCNNCYIEAQAVGKSPALCQPGSQFLSDYSLCLSCIDANADDGALTRRVYVDPKFGQYIQYCDGQDPQPIPSSTTSVPPAESAVTTDPGDDDDIQTTSQLPVETDTSVDPIPPPSSPTSDPEEPPTTSDPSQPGPTDDTPDESESEPEPPLPSETGDSPPPPPPEDSTSPVTPSSPPGTVPTDDAPPDSVTTAGATHLGPTLLAVMGSVLFAFIFT